MVALVNSAEGGTTGTTVTVANSGGLSGNAWSSVNIPGGTTLTFASAALYKGTLGYRVTPGSATGVGPTVRRSVVGWTKFRDRFYLRFSALPADAVQVARVTNGAGTDTLARLTLTTAGKLRAVNRAGSVIWTSSSSLAPGTWYRVEWIVVPGTTTSNGTMRVAYAAGDAAAAETFASTTVNTGTSGNLGTLYVGKISGTWNANVDFDDFLADDASSTTFLGASGSGPVVVDPTPAPEPVAPTWPPPDPYTDVIRSGGYSLAYRVSAASQGEPVEGAEDLTPTGGSIVDTIRPGARRTLSMTLAAEPGLYDLLSPEGILLTVFCRVTYINRQWIDVPMGVFDVDSERLTAGGGALSITAPDRWVRIQRSKFLRPYASTPGISVSDQIVELIRYAFGGAEVVNQLDTSSAVMGAQTWDDSCEEAILELAKGAGLWVFFDREGVATIADAPTIGASADWLVDASASGVLTELVRERSRTKTANVVVISSSAADGEKFATQIVWDSDPNSPTYAGTNPVTAPNTAGPFGIVPYRYSTPLDIDLSGAVHTAKTILARVSGLASQVSLEMAPNPAVDAGDVLDVLAPEERYDIPRTLERHTVDTVTHPLSEEATRIDGRSTRTEEL